MWNNTGSSCWIRNTRLKLEVGEEDNVLNPADRSGTFRVCVCVCVCVRMMHDDAVLNPQTCWRSHKGTDRWNYHVHRNRLRLQQLLNYSCRVLVPSFLSSHSSTASHVIILIQFQDQHTYWMGNSFGFPTVAKWTVWRHKFNTFLPREHLYTTWTKV